MRLRPQINAHLHPRPAPRAHLKLGVVGARAAIVAGREQFQALSQAAALNGNLLCAKRLIRECRVYCIWHFLTVIAADPPKTTMLRLSGES